MSVGSMSTVSVTSRTVPVMRMNRLARAVRNERGARFDEALQWVDSAKPFDVLVARDQRVLTLRLVLPAALFRFVPPAGADVVGDQP